MDSEWNRPQFQPFGIAACTNLDAFQSVRVFLRLFVIANTNWHGISVPLRFWRPTTVGARRGNLGRDTLRDPSCAIAHRRLAVTIWVALSLFERKKMNFVLRT